MDTDALQTAAWRARWRASLWDYIAILGWLAVLTVVGLLARALLSPAPAEPSYSPIVVDLMAFALTILPVWAYLTVGEAGRTAATWGKWRAGLRVAGPEGERPGFRRVAIRNAIKLLPWQLAHVAVARAILGADEVVTMAVTYALSLLIPAGTLTMAWKDPLDRALHDRIVGTQVVRS